LGGVEARTKEGGGIINGGIKKKNWQGRNDNRKIERKQERKKERKKRKDLKSVGSLQ